MWQHGHSQILLKGVVGCGLVPLVTICPVAGNPPGISSLSSSLTGGCGCGCSPSDKYCWFRTYSSFGSCSGNGFIGGDWGRGGEIPGATFTGCFSFSGWGRPCSFGTNPVRRLRLCKLRWRLKIPDRVPAAEVGICGDAPDPVVDFSGSVVGGKTGIAATWSANAFSFWSRSASTANRASSCWRKIRSTGRKNIVIKTNEDVGSSLPLYPLRFSDRKSVERIVMNNKASLVFGDWKSRRLRDVATLDLGHGHLHRKEQKYTHSYMSVWAFPATQSWIDPDPFLMLTADASCFFVTFTSPKFKCFITVNFPNAFTTKLFPDESQENDTLVDACVCSWRKSGRRSKIKRLVSCAILELTNSEDVWCSSRTRRLSLWEPKEW